MTRTQYPSEFKLRVAREAAAVGNASEVARKYEIHPTMVGHWLKAYRRDGESVFDRARRRGKRHEADGKADLARMRDIERENERLKRLLGENDLELAILRGLLKKETRRLPKG